MLARRGRLLAACLAVAGCRCPGEPAAPALGVEGGAVPAAPGEEIKAVFPRAAGPAHPLARALCEALHDVPSRRRAACCGGRGTPITLTAECVRVVSFSLHSGATTLDAARLAICARELAEGLAGCDWVGPTTPEPPESCRNLLTGTLDRGQRCRSSLECRADLHCRGSGPTDLGTCDLPRAAGTACGLSVDTLATYARQDVDSRHPECAGFCERRRCFDTRALGAACQVDAQCGRGRRCAGRACAEGARGTEGQPCVPGGCSWALRCIAGVCGKPRPGGAPCEADIECQGACLGADAARRGVCRPRC